MSNMAVAVSSLNENVLRINEALEKSKTHLLQRVRNLDEKIAEQQELSKLIMNEKAKAAGNRCNMAAGVDSLIEDLRSVNEVLEGLSISDDLKLNMLAAVPSLTENFRSVNVALEDISMSDLKRSMGAGVGSLTENLQIVNEAVEKAKKHLLQRIHDQNPDGKIDEKQELSKLNMNEVRDSRTEVEKANDELNNLVEKVRKLEDKMKEFEKKQVELLSNDL